MSKKIKLAIIGNPKPWQRAGVSTKDRQGRPLKRARFFERTDKTWKDLVRAEALKSRGQLNKAWAPWTGPVGATFIWFLKQGYETKARERISKRRIKIPFPIRPKTDPDIDNLEKIVLDACEGIIYENDVQVCRVQSEKYFSPFDLEPRLMATFIKLKTKKGGWSYELD